MSLAQSGLSIFGKLSIIIILIGAFLFGLSGTLYMALRSPEMKVPEVVGKDFLSAEKEIEAMGLKLRKRTDRFSQEKPNTILEQVPLPGETVKTGQLISVVVAREQAEEGEKAAEVKKETVNDNKSSQPEEPQSEVEKARQKRKAANKNANANKNGNANSNGNSNAGANSNSNSAGSGSANSGAANDSRPNTNAKNSNGDSTQNGNSRPATNATPAIRQNSNSATRPAATRPPETNRRDQ